MRVCTYALLPRKGNKARNPVGAFTYSFQRGTLILACSMTFFLRQEIFACIQYPVGQSRGVLLLPYTLIRKKVGTIYGGP